MTIALNTDSGWARLALVCSVVFSVSKLALGAERAPVSPSTQLAPPSGNSALILRVVDAHNGQPIAGVQVLDLTGTAEDRARAPSTDAQGEAKLDLAFLRQWSRPTTREFLLGLEHPQYAPRNVSWISEGGNVHQAIPAEYTCQLHRGITIGGSVQDDQHQPLANAQVRIIAWSGRGGRIQPGEHNTREYSLFRSPPLAAGGKAIITDAQGRWRVDNFPSDVENIRIRVVRDDGSDAEYATTPEPRPFSRPVPALSLAELRAGTAVFTIPTGFEARGRVISAQGAPVAGAKVMEADGRGEVRGEVMTNAEGRFRFRNRRARQSIWAVEAPGFALASEVITLKPGMPEAIVELQAARAAVLHFEWPDGQPAAGLPVKTLPFNNEGIYANFESKTGPDGTLVWSNAPVQIVNVECRFPGPGLRTVSLWAGHTQTVTVSSQPPDEVIVPVRATDARTRKPLDTFELRWADLDQQGAEGVLWAAGSNGIAQGKLRRAVLREPAWPRFRATAKGYLPGPITAAAYDQGINLELEPDFPVEGMVRRPDHEPAADAWVMVNRDGAPGLPYANSQSGPVAPLSHPSLNKIQSGRDGVFRLEGVREDTLVMALHESGYAQMAARELRANGQMTLRPWETLSGVLRIAEANAEAGQRVGLAHAATPQWGHPVHFETKTDDNGAFGFPRIPAGSYKVFRYLDDKGGRMVYSHRQQVEVLPGRPAKVQLGGRGVRVEGRLTASNSVGVDWTLNRHTLTAKPASKPSPRPAGPFREDFVREADYSAASRRARHFPPEPSAEYLLTFDRDGHFFVDDVLPGDYTLEVKVTELPQHGDDGRLVGTLSTNVVIPKVEGELSRKVQLGPYVLSTGSDPVQTPPDLRD